MNKIIAKLIPLAFLCTSCSYNTNTSEIIPIKYVYENIDENTMPILGYVAPKNNNEEQYKFVNEAGINVLIASNTYIEDGDNKELLKTLEYADKYNITILIKDPYLFESNEDVFLDKFNSREYKNHPCFGGFFIQDEPQLYEFKNIKKKRELFNKYIGDRYMFNVNLLPIDSYDNERHSDADYIDYVMNYIMMMNDPKYISYDFYGLDKEFPNIKENYFRNLSCISNLALDNSMAFYNFQLVTEHDVPSMGFNYRNPTFNEIFWEINTSIAYGAKGINYFCYQTPSNDSDEWGIYSNKGGSFINLKGERTETYYYCQKINQYIRSIQSILMNSNRVAMIKNESYKMTAKLYGNFVDNYKDVSSMTTSDDALLSIFDYKKGQIYYLINTSIVDDANIKIDFKKKKSFKIYNIDGNSEIIKPTNSLSFVLEPGHSVLVEPI